MALFKNLFDYSAKELKKMDPIKEEVLALEEKYAAMSEEELRAVTPALKQRLENGETLEDILPDAFAACREASVRAVGLKPYPVQRPEALPGPDPRWYRPPQRRYRGDEDR